MRLAYSTVFLAAAIPALAQPQATGNWNRVSLVSKTQTAAIRLKDGRSLQGKIRSVSQDGLSFLPDKKLTRVKISDVKTTVVKSPGHVMTAEGYPVTSHLGDALELRLRSGRTLQGNLEDADTYNGVIHLSEPGSEMQFQRDEIVEVRTKAPSHRGRNILIGGFGAGAIAGGIGYAVTKPECRGSNAHCTGTPPVVFSIPIGLAGGVIGALIPTGRWKTIYP